MSDLVERLNRYADDFEREADDALEAEERPDLWDKVLEVSLADIREAASVIEALEKALGEIVDRIVNDATFKRDDFGRVFLDSQSLSNARAALSLLNKDRTDDPN